MRLNHTVTPAEAGAVGLPVVSVAQNTAAPASAGVTN